MFGRRRRREDLGERDSDESKPGKDLVGQMQKLMEGSDGFSVMDVGSDKGRVLEGHPGGGGGDVEVPQKIARVPRFWTPKRILSYTLFAAAVSLPVSYLTCQPVRNFVSDNLPNVNKSLEDLYLKIEKGLPRPLWMTEREKMEAEVSRRIPDSIVVRGFEPPRDMVEAQVLSHRFVYFPDVPYEKYHVDFKLDGKNYCLIVGETNGREEEILPSPDHSRLRQRELKINNQFLRSLKERKRFLVPKEWTGFDPKFDYKFPNHQNKIDLITSNSRDGSVINVTVEIGRPIVRFYDGE
ncbi:MAG: hypothetical protein KKF56_03525 [Nanoarchaeota archaeon]|nr:hypothetical protein [Nanoarchaeota archaeon]